MAVAVLHTEEWDKFLNELGGRVSDSGKYLQAAAATFGFKDIIQHFADEMGPDGPWIPRSANTQARYAAILSGMMKTPAGGHTAQYNPSNKLLQMTGRLRGSLLPGAGGIERTGKTEVTLFSNVVYSRAHDQGNPDSGLPQREFMYLSPAGEEAVLNAMMNMIMEGL